MRNFFKGWKRKVGCVTLGLACVFAALWMRSLGTTDFVHFRPQNGESSSLGVSIDGHLGLEHRRTEPPPAFKLPVWYSYEKMDLHRLAKQEEITWLVNQWGLEIGDVSEEIDFVLVPYWSIVIPLTLLSAYLLLSKPRLPKPTAPGPDHA